MTVRTFMRRLIFATFALGVAACGERPRTEAVVVITNNGLRVPDDIDSVRVVINDDSDGSLRHDETVAICRPGLTTACYDLPLGAVLIPGARRPNDGVRVNVNALRNGEAVIENATVFHFTSGSRLRLDFALYPACLGSTACDDDGKVCSADGTCSELPPVRIDAAIDLAAPSAPVDQSIAPPDLIGLDLTGVDLTTPPSPDLAVTDAATAMPDLTTAPDLAPAPDLGEVVDPEWTIVQKLPNTNLVGENAEVVIRGNTLTFFAHNCMSAKSMNIMSGDVLALPTGVTGCPIDTGGYNAHLVQGFNTIAYFAGGAPANQIFDGINWGSATQYSSTYARGESAATAIGYTIFLIGGRNASSMPTNDIYRFDTGTNTLTTGGMTPLPYKLQNAAATTIGNKLYVVGGSTQADDHDKVLRFDVAEGLTSDWTEMTALPTPMADPQVTAVGGKIYAASRAVSGTTEIFIMNPTSGVWENSFNAPAAASGSLPRILMPAPIDELYVVGQVGTDVVLWKRNGL